MDQRNAFLLQLLQKLGAPLASAVWWQSPARNDAENAQAIASLLSESVKIGIGLSQAMNLKPADGDADAIRVALTGIAANLTADYYRHTGKIPTDADSARIQKFLESIIIFSDNFAPAAEHAQRLQTLDGTAVFFDPIQTNLYTMRALLPAIKEIMEFSFGQDPVKLIQDAAARIGEKAKEMQPGADALAEMVMVQALAEIFAVSYKTHTNTLSNEHEFTHATIEPVWEIFDKQAAMLQTLLNALSGSTGSSARGGGVKPAVNSPSAEAPAKPAAPAASATPPAQGGNPMSFFKKK